MTLVRAAAWPLTMLLIALASAPMSTFTAAAPVTPPPLPPAEHRSLQAFADANRDCGEWSDGCAVCLRHADGSFACSLPGIACQPGTLACRAPVKDKDAH